MLVLLKLVMWLLGISLGLWKESPASFARKGVMNKEYSEAILWAMVAGPVCLYILFSKALVVTFFSIFFALLAPVILISIGEIIPKCKAFYWATPLR